MHKNILFVINFFVNVMQKRVGFLPITEGEIQLAMAAS